METKAVLLIILTALGIYVAPSAFLGGLFMAIVLAYAVMIYSPPENKLSLWGTVLLAFVASTTIAQIHQSFLKAIPLQFAMGIAGAMSKPLLNSIILIGDKLPINLSKIIDKKLEKK